MNKVRNNELIQKLLWIGAGSFLIALSIHLFFGPTHIASGGLSGAAIVVNYLIPSWDIGTILLITNPLMFILGFFTLGRQFGLLTLVGSFGYSLWIMLMERVAPISKPLVDDLILTILIGSTLSGVGLSFVFNQHASTGGTDILGTLIHNVTHLGLAQSLLLVDGIVVMFGGIFISLDSALYAIVAIYLQSMVLDRMIAGFGRRIVMNITTGSVDEINHYINYVMHRGTSIYPMKGGYSQRRQSVILTVVHNAEYIRIKDFIEKTDPRAFVFVYSANEVMGEGFTYSLPSEPKLERGEYGAGEDTTTEN